MKTFRFNFGLGDALVVLAFVSLLGVQLEQFAGDPGVGWHLATGRLIHEQATVPQLDPFLSAPQARPWVSDQWLSDLFLYALYAAGSWPLLYAVLTVVFALTFGLVLLRGNIRISGAALASCFAALIAFKLSQVHFILRPVIFAFLFFALTYRQIFLIYRSSFSDESECLRRLRRSLLFLPPLFAVWANMHPSFFFGLILLLLVPASVILDRMVLGSEGSCLGKKHGMILQLLLFGLCLAATFVNPYGLSLHESIASLAGSDYFMRLNEEWLPPDFREYSGKLLEFTFMILALSPFAGGRRGLKWGFFEILLMVVFGHFALQSVRILPFYGIAVSIPLAQALANLGNAPFFERWQLFRHFKARLSNVEQREQRSMGGAAIAVVMAIVIIGAGACGVVFTSSDAKFGPPPNKYPYAAVDFIFNSLAADETAVVAAHPNWGGFITWQGRGRLKPIIDDRNTMLGEQLYRDFFECLRPGGDWRDFLGRFKTTHLLLNNKSPLGAALLDSGALRLLYRDEMSMVLKYE